MQQHRFASRRRCLHTAILAALVGSAAPRAQADVNAVTLNPVVVSGSRIEHSSFDLPSAVDVIAFGTCSKLLARGQS